MLDLIQEIYGTIMRNKLRTALTGFAVAWGIFMLIVLLGAGNGLIHAFENQSADMKMNSMKIYPGVTSKAFNGLNEGRNISLNESDMKITSKRFTGNITTVGATTSHSGILTYGKENVSITINGVFPNHTEMEPMRLVKGRFINKRDMEEMRKVIVLHQKTADILFSKSEAIGKYITSQGVMYQVVGVYSDQNSFSPSALVPFTTLQIIYSKGDSIDNIIFATQNLTDQASNDIFEKEYRAAIGKNNNFAPDDDSAIWIWNRFTQYLQQQSATNILNISIWVYPVSATAVGNKYSEYFDMGCRYFHIAQRDSRCKQYHAYYCQRKNTRVRHKESAWRKAFFNFMADNIGKCSDNNILRIYRHGSGYCNH